MEIIRNSGVLLILLFYITTTKAQQLNLTAGGDASSSTGSIAYSVGQTFYSTYTSSTGEVTQGIQQAYQISILGGTNHDITLSMKVYPNPTKDVLTLNVGDFYQSNLQLHLYDVTGKLIDTRKIITSIEYINLSLLPNATYFLKIIKNQTEIKTFKISKIN